MARPYVRHKSQTVKRKTTGVSHKSLRAMLASNPDEGERGTPVSLSRRDIGAPSRKNALPAPTARAKLARKAKGRGGDGQAAAADGGEGSGRPWLGSTGVIHSPAPYIPKYVKACAAQAWTLILHNTTTGEITILPFRCRSWRHEGECRRRKGAQDFVRIREALKKRPAWVYMVLTEKRRGSKREAYKRIWRKWQSLRQWIQRSFKGGKLEYIALVEQHKDGWPHVNILVYLPAFVAAAQADWQTLRRKVNKAAIRCGFGLHFWLEPVRSNAAIAGYFVKLCHEVAKITQSPVEAPRRFRRLRASRGLLPPVHKNPDLTGMLATKPKEEIENLIEVLKTTDVDALRPDRSEYDMLVQLEHWASVIFEAEERTAIREEALCQDCRELIPERAINGRG